jgi:hypothetical protein
LRELTQIKEEIRALEKRSGWGWRWGFGDCGLWIEIWEDWGEEGLRGETSSKEKTIWAGSQKLVFAEMSGERIMANVYLKQWGWLSCCQGILDKIEAQVTSSSSTEGVQWVSCY